MTDLTAIGNLIDAMRSYASERSQRPFDYIAALGLTGKELPHSNFIATLLNPHGSHGLGDSFLRALLGEIRRVDPRTGLIDTIATDVVDIQREQTCLVTREEPDVVCSRVDSTRFIDIVVRIDGSWLGQKLDTEEGESCKGLILLIENKVWTKDSTNQLRDYWNWAKTEYSAHHPIGIYLSPHARAPRSKSDHKFMVFGYANIVSALDTALEESHPTESVLHALQSYKWHMNDNLVMQDSELQKLAQDIYAEYGEIIDEIIRRKKTVFELAVEVLKEKLDIGTEEEGADSDFTYTQTRRTSTIFNFRPTKIARKLEPDSSIGGAWENREVQFEVDNGGHIMVVVRTGTPSDTIDEMRKRIRKSGVKEASNSEINKSWPRLYSEKLYNTTDLKSAKPDIVKATVEKWLEDGKKAISALTTHLFAPAAWGEQED